MWNVDLKIAVGGVELRWQEEWSIKIGMNKNKCTTHHYSASPSSANSAQPTPLAHSTEVDFVGTSLDVDEVARRWDVVGGPRIRASLDVVGGVRALLGRRWRWMAVSSEVDDAGCCWDVIGRRRGVAGGGWRWLEVVVGVVRGR